MRRTRLAALPAIAALLVGLAACSSAPEEPAPSSTASPTQSAAAAGTCAYTSDGSAAKPVSPPAAEPKTAKTATLKTSAGDLTIALDGEHAPCTVSSFVSLVSQKYFDQTTCHRLTTSGIFVLQCGDPTGTGRGGPGYSFGDETSPGMSYPAGTVAMANAGPDTNGSQFFLVYDDSTSLPPNYTVFGHLDKAGLATVRAVAKQGVAGGGSDGAPAEKVTILSATTA